jgi:predicted TIM-barrel fold metal-dependent hydrolase
MLIDSPTSRRIRTDLHQHLWPPELIAALRARRRPPLLEGDADRPLLRMIHEPDGRVVLAGHSIERRIAALDDAGIGRAVISLSTPLGIESLPAGEATELIAAYHAGIERLVAESGGRLAAWAAPPLQAADGGAEVVSAAVDRGFVGASIPSEVLADPELLDAAAPLLTMLARRGRPLFVHPGPGPRTAPYARGDGMPVWWPNLGVYPGLSVRAFFGWRAIGAERHPGLRICFAIMAGAAPFLEERWRVFSGETRAIDRNLFLDTASCGRLALECAMATYGVEQITFGTDIPVISPEPVVQALTATGPAALQAVTERNPLRLLDPTDMEQS